MEKIHNENSTSESSAHLINLPNQPNEHVTDVDPLECYNDSWSQHCSLCVKNIQLMIK